MAETSNSFNLNDRSQSGQNWYHTHPTIGLFVEWKCYRSDEKNSLTKWSGKIYTTGRSYGSFGYTLTVTLKVNGTEIASGVVYGPGLHTHEVTFYDKGVDIPNSNNADMTIYGSCSAYGSCDWGNNGNREDHRSLPIPSYNPYTAIDNYRLNSIDPQIGRKDSQEFTADYTITGGTNGIQWAYLDIYKDYNSWNGNNTLKGSNADKLETYKGTNIKKKFRITEAENGKTYYPDIAFYDGDHRYESNKLQVYTYQQPVISGVSVNKSSQRAKDSNSFKITGLNSKVFNSLESDFKVYYSLDNNSWNYDDAHRVSTITNINESNLSITWNTTASQMQALCPISSYDNKARTIYFRNYSPSANWASNSISTTVKLIYRPLVGISSVSLKKNNSNGTSIQTGQVITSDNSLTGIYVSWNFEQNRPEEGYINYYRIRLYDAAGNIVHTYYTNSQNYTISKTDIPKMQLTKIDITPAYKISDTDTRYYNGTITKINLAILVCRLSKPIIVYPINQTTWINNKPRICFKLPSDDDYSIKGTNYRYNEIQFSVNNVIIGLNSSVSNSTNIAPDCFNALLANLTYQRTIVFRPDLCSKFPIANSYSIKVRVRKNYYNDLENTNYGWSDWSDIVNISIKSANYTVNKGDKILADHYNTAISKLLSSMKVYGLSKTLSNVQPNVTLIKQDQYTYNLIYKEIVNIKNRVNNYGTYDNGRENIKFDYSNKILESFTPTKEYVTASANESANGTGRNYMKIIYDRLNLLV